jgi:hypothetical protein
MTQREQDMVPSTRNDLTPSAINPYHMAVEQFEAAAVGTAIHSGG